MTVSRPLTDECILPHRAFNIALKRIEEAWVFATHKTDAEGLAIIGESRTGKTSVLRTFLQDHQPSRDESGMRIPVLFASVPSLPTTKSLAGVLLEALHASDPERGTENEKTRRVRVLMKQTGTRMLMIDEFQHFYDRGSHKIMHHVADWLKGLIDATQTTLVIAGLPTALGVIDQNEQLMGRFVSPARLLRFDWQMMEDREEFISILATFQDKLNERYNTPDFATEQMAFKFWLATGGLMGYVAKLLRHAERDASLKGRATITLEDLHVAHLDSIWVAQRLPDLPQPFGQPSNLAITVDLIQKVGRIGTTIDLPSKFPRQRETR
jgi:hypothetical protein